MRVWTLTVVVTACVMLVGCGGVISDHPISDEKTSVLDERLIGWWEQAPKEGEEKEPQKRFLIGRHAEHPRLLELVATDLDKKQQVEVQRFRLQTIELAENDYLSFTDEKAEEFLIVRYEVVDDDAVRIQVMKEEVVALAIETGAIEGRVKKNPKYTGPMSLESRYSEVRLTASTDALRAWAVKADIWEGLGELTFRRVGIPVPKRGGG